MFLWWPLWARIINLIIKINLMVNWYNLHGKVKSKDLTRGALRALKILLLLVRNSRIKTFLMYYFLCSELSLNKVCFKWFNLKGWGVSSVAKEIQPERSIQNSDLYQTDFIYCNGTIFSNEWGTECFKLPKLWLLGLRLILVSKFFPTTQMSFLMI